MVYHFFFFKQKTAYELRISDWSSDVCSSDLWPARACVQSPRNWMRPSRTNEWQTRSVRHSLNSSLALGLAGQVTFTLGVKVGLSAFPLYPHRGPGPVPMPTACRALHPGHWKASCVPPRPSSCSRKSLEHSLMPKTP